MICPYCHNEMQQLNNLYFCPYCNSYLGMQNNQLYQNQETYQANYNTQYNNIYNNPYNNPYGNSYMQMYADTSNEEIIGKYYISVLDKVLPNNKEEKYIDIFREIEKENKIIHFDFTGLSTFLELLTRRMYKEAIVSFIFFILFFVLTNINIVLGTISLILYFIFYTLFIDFLYYQNTTHFLQKLKVSNKHWYEIPEYIQNKIYDKSEENKIPMYLIFMFLFSVMFIFISTFVVGTFIFV